MSVSFTSEQQDFLNRAVAGENLLVDACIGSGKTTSIQEACVRLHANHKKVLYLTYNRRLLLEARNRIPKDCAEVHTFHSFGGTVLSRQGLAATSERDVPKDFVFKVKILSCYNVLIIDEYQDMDEGIANMVYHTVQLLTKLYRAPQLLVVGDMDQKIYDYTSLDVRSFADKLLSSLPGGYTKLRFTYCFRLPAGFASKIGSAWGKPIVGCNHDCRIRETYDIHEVVGILLNYDPEDILVLGGGGQFAARMQIQNLLEESDPGRFNIHTVFSSGQNGSGRGVDTAESAVFTTYDSAKGMERPVCVVCDFVEGYLESRLKRSVDRNVLKNLFLVAASRGKREIIFYYKKGKSRNPQSMKWGTLLEFSEIGELGGMPPVDNLPVLAENCFLYKRVEDIDRCLAGIQVKKVRQKGELIEASFSEGMVDLSPCVALYAMCSFFNEFGINGMIRMEREICESAGILSNLLSIYDDKWSLQKKVLYYTALHTGQSRYVSSVKKTYVKKPQQARIKARLGSQFAGNERCNMVYGMTFLGMAGLDGIEKVVTGSPDVFADGVPWVLVFCESMQQEVFLACALHVTGLGCTHGMVWNLMTDEQFEVCVLNETAFLRDAIFCILKGLGKIDSVHISRMDGCGVRDIELE